MSSLAHVALASQVPYEPADVPDRGAQSVSTQEAAARAGQLRDPAQDTDWHHRLTPIDHQGPTSGPEGLPPGVDRPAMARDIAHLVPTHGFDVAPNLGTHVEQRAGVDMAAGGAPEPPFAPRRNTFRLPPPPAGQNLVYGE